MKSLKLASLTALALSAAASQAFVIVGATLNGNGLINYGQGGNVGLDVDKEFFTTNPIDLLLEVTAADVGQIREISEFIVNSSGLDWTDYHMEIIPLTGAFPTFVMSVLGNPWFNGFAPVANITVVNPLTIDVFWNMLNGQIFNTGYYNGTPGRLAIDSTNLHLGDRFVLRQYPTFVPEPGTFIAMGAGALALLIRRKRK